MQETSISWCDYSWNPVTGCTRWGPECENCWAEQLQKDLAKRENAPEYMSTDDWVPENAEAVVTSHEDRLDGPERYHYPSGPGKIFTVSMGDLFHSLVDDEFIEKVVDVARQHPAQAFIFLTKRPQRAADLDLDLPDNVWLGTSVGSGPGGEYPDTTHRIEALRDIDATVRWVSFEPLLEPVCTVDLEHIDWVVVGGENAPAEDRREMDHAWARDILNQCRDTGVPFHFNYIF